MFDKDSEVCEEGVTRAPCFVQGAQRMFRLGLIKAHVFFFFFEEDVRQGLQTQYWGSAVCVTEVELGFVRNCVTTFIHTQARTCCGREGAQPRVAVLGKKLLR